MYTSWGRADETAATSREDAMAIMAIYRSRDVDRETYNRLRAAVPIEPRP